MANSWQAPYDTGWVACSDWTLQHLGTALGGNIVHNLNAPLPKLLVKVMVSNDGADGTAREIVHSYNTATAHIGINVIAVDNNNLVVQTGTNGVSLMENDGNYILLDTESWYYKVRVWLLG